MHVQSVLPGRGLSPKLIDYIISFVDSDDLSACSTVCHAWVVPSRRRIFDSVIFQEAPAVYEARLREFLGFLKANADVARSIQFIELTYDWKLETKEMVHVDLCLVLEMLELLDNLTAVGINEICFTAPKSVPDGGFPQCPAFILHLHNIRHHEDDRYHLNNFIANCPNIEHLHTNNCQICHGHSSPDGGSWEFVLPSSLGLRCLDLTATIAPPFLQGLMKTKVVTDPTLAYLTVDLSHNYRSSEDMDYLRPFLHAVGPGLVAFDLRYETSHEEYYHGNEGEYA